MSAQSYSILVLTRECPPWVLGGQSYHLKNLYDELDRLGHDITVVGGRCRESAKREVTFSDGIDTTIVRYPSIRGGHLQFPLVAKWALRHVDLAAFDVVVSHTEFPFHVETPLIAKRHDCKAGTRRNVNGSVGRIRRLVDWTHRAVSRRSVVTAEHEIYNSDLCRRCWRAHYGGGGANSSVVHNGVDTDLFRPRGSQEDYVLHVGGTRRKGLEAVLTYAENGECPVRLVGEGNVSHPNVEIMGTVSQDELVRLYGEARATIHPARFEAFGLVVLESLACGTPVVVSDQCGAAELLTADTGVVTNDIATGVDQALDLNESDCVALARQHSWEKIANRTIETISTVIEDT